MTEKNTIIKELRNLARHMFVGREGDVYIYGSQALGNASEGSDWDILIITDDSVSTADDFTKYAFPFAELGWQYGQQITPLHYTRTQWEKESSTLFYHNVSSQALRL